MERRIVIQPSPGEKLEPPPVEAEPIAGPLVEPEPTPPPEPVADVTLEQRKAEQEQIAAESRRLLAEGIWTAEPPSQQELQQQEQIRQQLAVEAESAEAKVASIGEVLVGQQTVAALEQDVVDLKVKLADPEWIVDEEAVAEFEREVEAYRKALGEQREYTRRITDKKLAPLVQVKKDGSVSVDVVTALRIDIPESQLRDLGISQVDIQGAREYIAAVGKYREDVGAAVRAGREYRAIVAELAETHVPPGAGDIWLTKASYADLSKADQRAYDVGGVEALDAKGGAPTTIAIEDLKTLEQQRQEVAKETRTERRRRESARVWESLYGTVQAAALDTHEQLESKKQAGPVRQVWRLLTPWSEETGDTFLRYMAAWPERVRRSFVKGFTQPSKPPSQAHLKAQYEAEAGLPTWAQVLFGATVARDKVGEEWTYRLVMAGLPPDIAPAGKIKKVGEAAKRLVKTAGPEDVRMSPRQFDDFVKARARKPGLTPESWRADEVLKTVRQRGLSVDWDAFVKEITQGGIKTPSQATRWVTRHAKPISAAVGEEAVTPATVAAAKGRRVLSATEEAAELRRVAAAFNESVKARHLGSTGRVTFLPLLNPYRVPDKQLKPAEWRPFRAGELSRERMEKLLAGWRQMTPNQALHEMMASNLVTVAVMTDPMLTMRILSRATPKARERALAVVSPQLKEAVKGKNAVAAQKEAVVDTQVALKASAAVQQLAQTATKAHTEVKTKAMPASVQKVQLQPFVMPAPAVAPAVSLALIAPPRPGVVTLGPKPRRVRKPSPSRAGRGRRGVPSAKRLRLRLRGQEVGPIKLPSTVTGPFAWQQGELKAGKVYYVISPPFKSNADVTRYIGVSPPSFATVKGGPGAALRSIQTLTGKPIKQLTIDLGIQDIIVKSPKGVGQSGAMKFRADPEQKTKGDITIRRPYTVKRKKRAKRRKKGGRPVTVKGVR